MYSALSGFVRGRGLGLGMEDYRGVGWWVVRGAGVEGWGSAFEAKGSMCLEGFGGFVREFAHF